MPCKGCGKKTKLAEGDVERLFDEQREADRRRKEANVAEAQERARVLREEGRFRPTGFVGE